MEDLASLKLFLTNIYDQTTLFVNNLQGQLQTENDKLTNLRKKLQTNMKKRRTPSFDIGILENQKRVDTLVKSISQNFLREIWLKKDFISRLDKQVTQEKQWNMACRVRYEKDVLQFQKVK